MARRTWASIRAVAAAMLVLAVAAGRGWCAEAAFPTHPVRLVIGLAPGGSGDALARILSRRLTDATGQPWIVDNRSGAAGNLATEIVARASPDGYTLLVALNSQLTISPSLYRLAFDVEKDLLPLAALATTDQVLVVHPAVPARNIAELLVLARQKAGSLNYGSSGIGAPDHMGVLLLQKRTGVEMTHIAYKGGGPTSAALLAGEIQLSISSVAVMIQHVQTGRVRALAIASGRRAKLLPDVPTIAESGYPGFEVNIWWSLLAPRATPRPAGERIASEVREALKHADVQAAMERLGMNPMGEDRAALAARMREEAAMFAALVKDAGIAAQFAKEGVGAR